MTRLVALFSVLAILAGCAGSNQVENSEKADLGEFRLGHNIVVASKMQRVPGSREASEDEWVNALTTAFDERFARYEGNQLYHFGVSVEGYMLAPPGVPVVAAPKSAVILYVTVWDDAEGRKINDEPHQLLIFESFDENSILGTGYTLTAEEQLANLALNSARELEKWLEDQQEESAWFALKPDTELSQEESGETSDTAAAAEPGATVEESASDLEEPAQENPVEG